MAVPSPHWRVLGSRQVQGRKDLSCMPLSRDAWDPYSLEPSRARLQYPPPPVPARVLDTHLHGARAWQGTCWVLG